MSVLFGREGASVAVADLNAESAEETAELVRAEGATAEVIAADAAERAGRRGDVRIGEEAGSADSTEW